MTDPESQPARKGVGVFRHCYAGQEAMLKIALKAKNMSLEEFNHRCDAIEAERRLSFRLPPRAQREGELWQ